MVWIIFLVRGNNLMTDQVGMVVTDWISIFSQGKLNHLIILFNLHHPGQCPGENGQTTC